MNTVGYSPPLLLVGEEGSGRSTLVTAVIQHYIQQETSYNKKQIISRDSSETSSITKLTETLSIKLAGDSDSYLQQNRNASMSFSTHSLYHMSGPWHVFYHYVGMYPRSSELRHILQRVWSIHSLSQPKSILTITDFNSLAKEVLLLLSTRSERRTLLIIDSIDKVSEYTLDTCYVFLKDSR